MADERLSPSESVPLALEARLVFQVSPQMMSEFARISGDYAPMHTDESFAKSKGYRGPIVYGGLLVSLIMQIVSARLMGSQSVCGQLEIQFPSPLYTGESATLIAGISHFSEASRAAKIRIRILTEDRVIAEGSVTACLK
jgi:acyl dehydratase